MNLWQPLRIREEEHEGSWHPFLRIRDEERGGSSHPFLPFWAATAEGPAAAGGVSTSWLDEGREGERDDEERGSFHRKKAQAICFSLSTFLHCKVVSWSQKATRKEHTITIRRPWFPFLFDWHAC